MIGEVLNHESNPNGGSVPESRISVWSQSNSLYYIYVMSQADYDALGGTSNASGNPSQPTVSARPKLPMELGSGHLHEPYGHRGKRGLVHRVLQPRDHGRRHQRGHGQLLRDVQFPALHPLTRRGVVRGLGPRG